MGDSWKADTWGGGGGGGVGWGGGGGGRRYDCRRIEVDRKPICILSMGFKL